MKIIGLTGGCGTGKSFVAAEFKALGAKIIDADRMAHRAIAKGTPAYRKIVKRFGREVLTAAGSVDRKSLARIVFNDARALAALENIVHPEVIRMIMARIARARVGDIVVLDAPLLIEANLAGITDLLVVVNASRKRQITRCVRKFGVCREEVLRRIDSQIPLRQKILMADFVIDNNGAKAATKKQVRKVWCAVWK